jgi:hypothetical protein
VASGSINPWTCEYEVVDVETGERVAGNLVDGLTWVASPDGAHAAYIGFIPHFMRETDRRPQLCLDDECALSGEPHGYSKQDVHVDFMTSPQWSSDSSSVVIVAENYDSHVGSIIVRHVGGETLDIPAPIDAEGGLGQAWDGGALLLSGTNGKWRLAPGASAFVTVKGTP